MTDCVSENKRRCNALARIIGEVEALAAAGHNSPDFQSALKHLRSERETAYRELGREVAAS